MPNPTKSQHKILIVDDTTTNVEVLEGILELEGYQTFSSSNGKHALEIIDEIQPDIILLDIMMPGMNGLEVCEKLKENPIWKHIPVIFITALCSPQDISKAFEVGGVDYITKPICREEVIHRIQAQLEYVSLFGKQRELIDKLETMAKTDQLTGLPNRRQMIENIKYEVIRFRRGGKPFSIAIGDIDDFKKINDTYGHAGGDFVLINVAELLRNGCRNQDLVCRWGGEEFLLLLPETDAAGAFTLAEKQRQTIANVDLKFEGKQIKVTICFGISTFNQKGQTYEECIRLADDSLYAAKEGEKNKVIVHQPV